MPRQRTGVSTAWILAACAAALAVAVALSIMLGSNLVRPGAVVDTLTGGGDDFIEAIVASRVRRTLAGALVGVCLAVTGVIMQGITRNPLGDPGLLRANIGAATSIVTA